MQKGVHVLKRRRVNVEAAVNSMAAFTLSYQTYEEGKSHHIISTFNSIECLESYLPYIQETIAGPYNLKYGSNKFSRDFNSLQELKQFITSLDIVTSLNNPKDLADNLLEDISALRKLNRKERKGYPYRYLVNLIQLKICSLSEPQRQMLKKYLMIYNPREEDFTFFLAVVGAIFSIVTIMISFTSFRIDLNDKLSHTLALSNENFDWSNHIKLLSSSEREITIIVITGISILSLLLLTLLWQYAKAPYLNYRKLMSFLEEQEK